MAKIGSISLSGQVKIIVSLIGKNTDELSVALCELNKSDADIIEWRVDSLAEVSPEAIRSALTLIHANTKKTLLATLRTSAEGGWATVSAADYRKIVTGIIESGLANAIDIEIDRAGATKLIELAKKNRITSVASFHNFNKTPPRASILSKFRKMHEAGADVLKMALMPQKTADVITLIEANREVKKAYKKPLITIAMGGLGSITRIAAKAIGSAATFASLTNSSAPGQLTIKETSYFLNLFGN